MLSCLDMISFGTIMPQSKCLFIDITYPKGTLHGTKRYINGTKNWQKREDKIISVLTDL